MNRKPKTIAFWTGRLPHWEVEEGRYFITIHLAGAIPIQGRARLRELADNLRRIEAPQAPEWLRLQRRIFAEMERWLDGASWNTRLQRPDVADVVVDAIEHRHQRGRLANVRICRDAHARSSVLRDRASRSEGNA